MNELALLNEEIKKVEKKINVNSFYINEINIWPIVRTSFLNSRIEVKFGEKFNNNNSLSLSSFYFHVIDFFKTLKLFTKKEKNLFLYYAKDHSSNLIINNQTINKHFTPFDYEFGKNNIFNVEIGKIDTSIPRTNALNISFLYFLVRPLFVTYYKFKLKAELISISNYIKKFKALDKGLIKNIDNFFALKLFFRILLIINKPKRVFVKSFDNLHSFSLIGAANELGIETIEYQHGQQGENSLRYSNWNNIPIEGFKTIPKIFWLWEEIFENKFSKWISSQEFHKTYVGVNVWAQHYSKYIDLGKIDITKTPGKSNVLFCLQFISIPKIIIDVMKNSQDIIWYLRLHPRHKNDIQKLYKILNQNKISLQNIEIELSNDLKLEELITNMDYVISGYSTVLYEAYILGKKAITIDSIGKEAYKEFIKRKLIYYASNAEKLISLLKI